MDRLTRITRADPGGFELRDDLRVHFGVGPAARIDLLEIRWPSGLVDRITGLAVDQIIRVREGSGMVSAKSAGGSSSY